jgi:hypothetical protein
LKATPGASSSSDDFRLVQADDRFSQCIVARISNAADGRLDPRIAQPAGITDRKVLRPPFAVMDQAFCVFLGHAAPVPRRPWGRSVSGDVEGAPADDVPVRGVVGSPGRKSRGLANDLVGTA